MPDRLSFERLDPPCATGDRRTIFFKDEERPERELVTGALFEKSIDQKAPDLPTRETEHAFVNRDILA